MTEEQFTTYSQKDGHMPLHSETCSSEVPAQQVEHQCNWTWRLRWSLPTHLETISKGADQSESAWKGDSQDALEVTSGEQKI
eukprot:256754-Amphidinium_carterae.2